MTTSRLSFVRVLARHIEQYDPGSRVAGEIVYTFYEGGRMLGHATLDAATKRALLTRLYRLTEATAICGWTPQSGDTLQEIGQTFFSLIVPPQARSLLFAAPGGGLVLDVQDHDIPWELLHDGNAFLSAVTAVGRQLPSQQLPRPVGRHSVRVLVVGNPEDDLPGAESEARFVETKCAEALSALSTQYGIESTVEGLIGGTEATKANVLFDRLLNDKAKVDIFHYAGHARFDARSPDHSGLVLADGELKGYEARQMKSSPLVFVNGCRASRSGGADEFPTHGLMSGLAAEFIAGGATGYIAPLWAVADGVAHRFAEFFYAAVIDGESLGRAVLHAKQEVGDPDALAYTLFGDPDSTLVAFAPRLTAGPFVNELGIQRIIELEREYPALEILAVNDLPWILWDDIDIRSWIARIPISDRKRAIACAALSTYVEEFGDRVLRGEKRFLAVVNAVTLRDYLFSRGPTRVQSLTERLRPFIGVTGFAMLIADLGSDEIDEIELVSKQPEIPPRARESVYVFNKQPRFEDHPVTYNLYQDFSPHMIDHYWGQLRRQLLRAADVYEIPETAMEFDAEWFAAINCATVARLERLAHEVTGRRYG